jgi:hypothetical protein
MSWASDVSGRDGRLVIPKNSISVFGLSVISVLENSGPNFIQKNSGLTNSVSVWPNYALDSNQRSRSNNKHNTYIARSQESTDVAVVTDSQSLAHYLPDGDGCGWRDGGAEAVKRRRCNGCTQWRHDGGGGNADTTMEAEGGGGAGVMQAEAEAWRADSVRMGSGDWIGCGAGVTYSLPAAL